jgi:hypothetical protein
MKSLLCFILILLSFSSAVHRASQEQDKYKINPTPDPASIYKSKVYVPTDLEDAFGELQKMLRPDLLKEMKNGSEQDMIRYHMGLGLWMRNNWGLWGGSRLAKYFNGVGIFHPDDMSGVILDSFWRHLNSQPIKLEEQVAYYQRFWKVNAEPKRSKCPLDGSMIELSMSIDDSENNQPRTIHVGRCKKRKHLWAYEHDKGWYRPDAALRKRIDQEE